MHETMDREYEQYKFFFFHKDSSFVAYRYSIFLLTSQKTEWPYEFLIRD
jgi:hypothetical protein